MEGVGGIKKETREEPGFGDLEDVNEVPDRAWEFRARTGKTFLWGPSGEGGRPGGRPGDVQAWLRDEVGPEVSYLVERPPSRNTHVHTQTLTHTDTHSLPLSLALWLLPGQGEGPVGAEALLPH